MTRLKNNPAQAGFEPRQSQAGFEPRIFLSRDGRLNHLANEAVTVSQGSTCLRPMCIVPHRDGSSGSVLLSHPAAMHWLQSSRIQELLFLGVCFVLFRFCLVGLVVCLFGFFYLCSLRLLFSERSPVNIVEFLKSTNLFSKMWHHYCGFWAFFNTRLWLYQNVFFFSFLFF